ncbi:PucR family transcriptional regulator ligand-binding domain-containing protein [Streptomyces sp. NPDC001250]|uniref:PucR family transcriptional regulator ligand-binding domain-containing protein n=1 Tax=unclassified Streptomyces TaxID=2593676 RepID=UPI003330DA32
MPETSTPAVPPTPPVPLSALLAREDLALRQIAGPADRGTVIHWAHTSEMADPYPYLLGGELLLTAGVHVPEAAGSGTYFDDYVSRIVAAGGAALGFGLAPVHDTVPRALVAACERHGLPLLEVPPQTTFSGVARAVWQLMAQARLAELRRVTEAQQGLASAAARPDPVPSVLRRLAQHLSGHAVLFGPDGTALAGAGREPSEEVRAALTDLTAVVRPTGAPAPGAPAIAAGGRTAGGTGTDTAEDSPPAPDPSHPADDHSPTPRHAPTPTNAASGRTAGETDTDTAENSPPAPNPSHPADDHSPTPRHAPAPANAASRRTAGRTGTDTAEDSLTPPNRSHPTDDHSPAPRPAPAPAIAAGGGTVPASARQVVPPATSRPAATPAGSSPARPLPASATATVGSTHLAAYALGSGEGFVLGVATARREPGDHTIASVACVLLSLLTGEHHSGAGAARSSALVRLLLGSAPEEVAPLLGAEAWVVVHARPEAQVPDAVAASALGAALGSPLVDLGRDVVRVLVPGGRVPEPQPGWTLGVSAAVQPREWPAADAQAARALARARATRTALIRHGARPGLTDLVPRADAEAHAHALLAPLADRPELTDTLRNWLALHGSWDRTAVALDVHRNTVRQRIARCAALLATDLDDPDVRMELWFALRHG